MFKQFGLYIIIIISLAVSLVVLLSHPFGPIDDGQFYITLADLIGSQGWIQNLPWIYFSNFRDASPGLHFLYPVMLIPFTLLLPKFYAAVVAAAVFFTVMNAVFYRLLVSQKVNAPIFWTVILLISSEHFLYRTLFTRPISLSIIVLLLTINFLQKKQHIALLALSFFYVWSYNAYILLPFLVGTYFIVDYFFERVLNYRPLVYSLVGTCLGLLINPFFPKNIQFLHFLTTPSIFNSTIQTANEWLSYSLVDFIVINVVPFVLFLSAFWLFVSTKNSLSKYDLKRNFWAALVSFIFLIATLRSKRFVEYWVPFSILFSALIFSPYISRLQWHNFLKSFKSYWQFKFACGVVLVTLSFFAIYTLRTVYIDFHTAKSAVLFKGASDWLLANSQEGDIVFNTQWDQFPQLFYWNSKNYYIVGMDPTFMYLHDKDKYWKWRKVNDDQVINFDTDHKLLDIVKGQFGSKFLFLENDRNPKLKLLLETDQIVKQDFPMVYSDSAVSLYQVR